MPSPGSYRRRRVSETDNRTLFLRFVDAWNSRDTARMVEFWSPDLVHHHRDGDYGRDEVFTLMSGFMEAFPDLRFDVEQVVADGDFVSARMKARATHQNAFAGFPPTGREVAVTVMGMVRIDEGRIAEHWNVMDELALMQQLGLIPQTMLDAIS
jgi:C-1 hydroxylase